jgi:hypothetical protein
MSFIPPPPDRTDIDFGTRPDRTTKSITMEVRERTDVEDENIGGSLQKYTSEVDVHIFVRDVKMRGNKREPQELIDLEKYVIEYIALNRLNFIDRGIQNILITGVQSFIDTEYVKQGVWYHTIVTLEVRYYMSIV